MKTFLVRTKTWLFILVFALFPTIVWSFLIYPTDNPVLIISSHNPEALRITENINDFVQEYKQLGGESSHVIESMNCKSFSDATEWKETMEGILGKYTGKRTPSAIVLLGQEARAAYLAQDEEMIRDIPVVYALSSRNMVDLPQDSIETNEWMPVTKDMITDHQANTLEAAVYYDYDIEANLNLIHILFPHIKTLALVSDNSYGGVNMQAMVKQVVSEKYPHLDLVLFDGRVMTITDVAEEVANLPEHSVVLLATWRVDNDDVYFLPEATSSLEQVNPDVPVFTITSIGIGNLAIGGVIPTYKSQGKEIARKVYAIQHAQVNSVEMTTLIDNQTVLDHRQLTRWGLNPVDREFENLLITNLAPSFYRLYKYQVWGLIALFFSLVIGVCVALAFYFREKRLKDKLERSQIELQDAKERAEESNRLKSAFLASMSHEIRTPLNSIVGFSNILISSDCSEEEKEGYFEIINTNCDLLLRLISDVLEFSRLESDKMAFQLKECDMVQASAQVFESIPPTRRNGNELLFTSSCDRFMLRTDRQRVQQVLANLLTNAIKFTQNGKITLSLDMDEKNKNAIFAVSDTGMGIPPDKQQVIFERFEKLDEYSQGAGLGLAICQLIVSRWGGEIWVDPEYTEGARFIFTHPIDC